MLRHERQQSHDRLEVEDGHDERLIQLHELLGFEHEAFEVADTDLDRSTVLQLKLVNVPRVDGCGFYGLTHRLAEHTLGHLLEARCVLCDEGRA